MGLTVLGPASLSSERRGVIQQPGIILSSGGRLQHLPLPLTQEFWDWKHGSGLAAAVEGGQQSEEQQSKQRQGAAAAVVVPAERRPMSQEALHFPSLAESTAMKTTAQKGPTLPSSLRRSGGGSAQEAARGAQEAARGAEGGSAAAAADKELRLALLASWPGSLEHILEGLLVGPPPPLPSASSAAARPGASSTPSPAVLPAVLAADAAEAAAAALRTRPMGAAGVGGVRTTHIPTAAGKKAAPTSTPLSVYIAVE